MNEFEFKISITIAQSLQVRKTVKQQIAAELKMFHKEKKARYFTDKKLLAVGGEKKPNYQSKSIAKQKLAV